MRLAVGHVKTEREMSPLPMYRKCLADRRPFSPSPLHPLMDKPSDDAKTGRDRLHSGGSETHAALCDHREKAL